VPLQLARRRGAPGRRVALHRRHVLVRRRCKGRRLGRKGNDRGRLIEILDESPSAWLAKGEGGKEPHFRRGKRKRGGRHDIEMTAAVACWSVAK
jgi:hypothetical protein